MQLDAEAAPPDALAAVAGTTPLTAVFRVPLPRVQTALRFVVLEPGVPVATALDNARVRAEREAAADASHLTDRPRAVAAAEAAALGRPDCRCVVALVVDGDRAGLDAVARRTPVRAVEAAPPGTTERGAGALAAAAGADRPRGPAARRRPGAAGILIGSWGRPRRAG